MNIENITWRKDKEVWHLNVWNLTEDNYLEFVFRRPFIVNPNSTTNLFNSLYEEYQRLLKILHSPTMNDGSSVRSCEYTPGCDCEVTTSALRDYDRADSGKNGSLGVKGSRLSSCSKPALYLKGNKINGVRLYLK